MTVVVLDSAIQAYPWGSHDGIAQVLGRAPSKGPQAELWMGAHPVLPSPLKGKGTENLRQLLERQPHLLGEKHQELPFLFKVLSASQPLSLQVHPSLLQAQQGFAQENARGVPLDAPHRNYRDANHKPELIVALTPFEALCGFLPPHLLNKRLEVLGGEILGLAPVAHALEQGGTSGLRAAFLSVFELSKPQLESQIDAVLKNLDAAQAEPEQAFASGLSRMFECYGYDPGILAALFLGHVRLSPGQGLYLAAGTLHSYLSGTGLELMASSDNVLRAGLTQKHVDVEELGRVVRFEPESTSLVKLERNRAEGGALVDTYLTPAREFSLRRLHLGEGDSFTDTGPDILLVEEGSFEVKFSGQTLILERGQQAFCAGSSTYELQGVGRVACAGAGIHSSGAASFL